MLVRGSSFMDGMCLDGFRSRAPMSWCDADSAENAPSTPHPAICASKSDILRPAVEGCGAKRQKWRYPSTGGRRMRDYSREMMPLTRRMTPKMKTPAAATLLMMCRTFRLKRSPSRATAPETQNQ